MDRRQFLKISAIGTATLAAGGLNEAEAAKKSEVYSNAITPGGYISEPARKIPVVDSADVVVVGGGPAGFAAGIAAARQGADVLVLERQYFLGGLFTGCGVTPIINMYSPVKGGEPVQAVKGICDELCQRLAAEGMLSRGKIIPKADPEAAKYFMEEMFAEAGVRLLYGVQVAGIRMSGDRITHVVLEGKSGRLAVSTSCVVDCSGDGDVLAWAGEDYNTYKDDIGAMWRVGNAFNLEKADKTCIKGVATRHAVGEKNQDGLDIYNLTRVQTLMRKRMWEEAAEFRQKEGCGDIFLLDSPSVVGVRITRVLNGLDKVTVEGAVEGKSYDDVIGFAGADSSLTLDGVKHAKGTRRIWQVPYGALLPKRVSNLLVGGRCFSFEHGIRYDAREVGTCLMTGQAAGTAAGSAVLRRCACRDIDVSDLQSRLRAQNVKLDW